MMFENSLRNKTSDCSKSEMKREDESDDDCVETLDKFPPLPKIRGQISISTTRCQRWCWEDAYINYTSGKAIALQRAIAFASASPSFTIVMHPSLPVGFGKRHLMKQPAGNAILKLLDGGTWSFKFTYSKPKAQFQQGWRAFVRGNNSSDDYGLFISDLEQSEALVLSEFSNIISEV
ncbi:hypothetical protein CerSpe_281850 [Prunus speciosa]